MRSCTTTHASVGKKIIQNAVKLGIRITSRIGCGCKASGRGSQDPADLKMRLLAWSAWLTSEAFSVWALTLPSSLREPHHLSSRVASKKECKQSIILIHPGSQWQNWVTRGPFPSQVSWHDKLWNVQYPLTGQTACLCAGKVALPSSRGPVEAKAGDRGWEWDLIKVRL